MKEIGIGLVSFVGFIMFMAIFSKGLDGSENFNQVVTAVTLAIIFAIGMALIF